MALVAKYMLLVGTGLGLAGLFFPVVAIGDVSWSVFEVLLAALSLLELEPSSEFGRGLPARYFSLQSWEILLPVMGYILLSGIAMNDRFGRPLAMSCTLYSILSAGLVGSFLVRIAKSHPDQVPRPTLDFGSHWLATGCLLVLMAGIVGCFAPEPREHEQTSSVS